MSSVCDHHEIGKFFGTKTRCSSKVRRPTSTDFGQLIRLRLPTKQIFIRTWLDPMFNRVKLPINALEPLLPLVTPEVLDEPIIRLRIAAVVYIHMKWWLMGDWIGPTKQSQGITSLDRIADESYNLSRHLEATASERLLLPCLVLDFLYQAARWDTAQVHKILSQIAKIKPIRDFTWDWFQDGNAQALVITGDLSWPNPQQLVISTATENFKGKVIDAVKASLERCPDVNASPTDSDLDIYTRHRISITSLISNPPPPGNEDFLDAWYRQGDEQRRR